MKQQQQFLLLILYTANEHHSLLAYGCRSVIASNSSKYYAINYFIMAKDALIILLFEHAKSTANCCLHETFHP